MEKLLRLKPIKEEPQHWDEIEKRIKKLFKDEIFLPILSLLNVEKKVLNSLVDVISRDILSGKIYYSNGSFHGKFNSSTSKQLKELGATWDSKSYAYFIDLSVLPMNIRSTISLAKSKFDEKLKKIDEKLNQINPKIMVGKLNIAPIFDKTLWKVEKEFKKSVENISIVPTLSNEERASIASDWQNNLELYIKNFSQEQIIKLRKDVQDNVFVKGNRREVLIKKFMEEYNVTENKAKFWARQETNLLMAKYKETRYTDAGVDEYEWRCVHMPHQKTANGVYKAGEVRYAHAILEGKIFSWKDPPVTTAPSEPQRRNNPGQDYNCRCFALPIVRFKK